MDSFQDVVLVHLAGHTHTEYFELLRDATNQTKPIHSILGGGSITTYTDKNPNLQVLIVHKKTGLVLNTIAYAANLAEANAAPDQDPAWGRKFDYLSEYNLKDLSPGSLDDLADRMKEDEELAVLYEANTDKSYGKPSGSCNEGCRNYLWCRVRTSLNWGLDDCLGEPHIDFKSNFEGAFLETFMSPWIEEQDSQ